MRQELRSLSEEMYASALPFSFIGVSEYKAPSIGWLAFNTPRIFPSPLLILDTALWFGKSLYFLTLKHLNTQIIC